MVTLNEINDNPATSTVLSVVGLALKNSHTQNMLLCIESTERYTHHKPVEVAHCAHHKPVEVAHCILLHRKGKFTIAKLK
jgi:hypothetical protein